MEVQRAQNKENFQNFKKILKMNKIEGITLPDFWTYYKSTGIETMQYWCHNRQISQ